ncbi:hypothetical protein CDL12_29402 [Handroanthus impetiginosus]|uniref:Uncharacterized protein n=1 Tax=Handroanthus impetiginosus TaxID=429701 RepID=A0A2G9FYI3_9LAMI|nr:hypothetical protein CDL12_29402 [Handroanthus impetiginosus]
MKIKHKALLIILILPLLLVPTVFSSSSHIQLKLPDHDAPLILNRFYFLPRKLLLSFSTVNSAQHKITNNPHLKLVSGAANKSQAKKAVEQSLRSRPPSVPNPTHN